MSEFTDFPTCPHCSTIDHDWWDGLDVQVVDGTEWTRICGECGQSFDVMACVDISFQTKPQSPESDTPATASDETNVPDACPVDIPDQQRDR